VGYGTGTAHAYTAAGTAGQVLISNGSSAPTWGAAASGGITYTRITSTTTLTNNQGVIADTTGGAFTVNLPASPSTGAQVFLADGGAWGTNNLTVGRNGSTIEGVAQDLVCDITGVSIQMLYDGTTWQVYAQAGAFGNSFTGTGSVVLATSPTIDSPTYTGTLTGGTGVINIGSGQVYKDASGNVGIGTSSPGGKLEVSGQADFTTVVGAGYGVRVRSPSGSATPAILQFTNNPVTAQWAAIQSPSADVLAFNNGGGAEKMRIDSSGNLLVGTTSAINGSGCPIQALTTAANQAMYLRNSNAVPYGMFIDYSSAAPNNTTSFFADFRDTGGQRFGLRSNGGIANYSANNVNLSDERTKTDIQDAGNYLAKICSIPVRTFKYKDQSDDILNLGVIAQEVEAVAPELVDVSGFGETPEDGVPLKAIYQTDLQYALMKCIQEQQAIIEQLKADVAALKGN
jgi:Chaperone of endosialidase